MRGRGLMMVAGMKMGQQKAAQQAQAQANQQAAVEDAKQQGAAEAQAAAAQVSAPAAGGLDDASMAQLKQLADLHTSGVLSDEEFTAAKKKILG